MIKQRWVFTDKELLNPIECTGDDEFVAHVGMDKVVVYRNGEISRYYGDGELQVDAERLGEEIDDEIRLLAAMRKDYYRYDPTNEGKSEFADNWRDVIVDDEGFLLKIHYPKRGWIDISNFCAKNRT